MSKDKVQRCTKCGVEKKLSNFYMTDSVAFKNTRRVPICKDCLKSLIETTDAESVFRMIDKPYIASLWKSCLLEYDSLATALINYMRQINSLPQYKHMTFAHSAYDADLSDIDKEMEQKEIKIERTTNYDINKLREKWGYQFKDEDLIGFESLYRELESNYLLQTAQHVEYLKLACIANYNAKRFLAEGDTKQAKDYLDMFDKIAKGGNLAPSQLSKADLQGGLNTFGELVKRVEQELDIIPILPRFMKEPKDDVDLTIYYYVSYIQHLLGQPLGKYEDIYKFIEQRKLDYELHTLDDIDGDIESGVKNDIL